MGAVAVSSKEVTSAAGVGTGCGCLGRADVVGRGVMVYACVVNTMVSTLAITPFVSFFAALVSSHCVFASGVALVAIDRFAASRAGMVAIDFKTMGPAVIAVWWVRSRCLIEMVVGTTGSVAL